MAETILSNPIISEAVLPFMLVFTIVFAILQKSKILGDGKKSIDAMVSLVVGLITITFARAVGIINNFLPFLAVAIVIILVFLIMIALVHSGDNFEWIGSIRKITIVLAAIAVVVATLIFTGAWDYLVARFTEPGSNLATNIVFIAIIVVGFIVVLFGKSKGSGSSDDKKKGS